MPAKGFFFRGSCVLAVIPKCLRYAEDARSHPWGDKLKISWLVFDHFDDSLELQATSSLWLAINWMMNQTLWGNGWKSPNLH